MLTDDDFPTADEVVLSLRVYRDKYAEPPALDEDGEPDEDNDGGLDVRLQVWPDGDWTTRFGNSSYDQDHRGYWGSGYVIAADTDAELLDLAKDMVEQCKEHAAQAGQLFDPDAPPTEPSDDDYTTTDYLVFRQHGGFTREPLLVVPDGAEWTDIVKEHMDAEEFWPNVWFLGERGDWNLLDITTGTYATKE